MKRFICLCPLALLGLGTITGSATATHSGPELRAYGHGTQATITFDFSARLSDREAELGTFGEPHGYIRIDSSTGSLSAEVVCLLVVFNRATLVGNVTRATGTLDFAREVRLHVTDNTLPSGLQPAPDQLGFLASAFTTGGVCDVPLTGHPPITSGDIVVEQN